MVDLPLRPHHLNLHRPQMYRCDYSDSMIGVTLAKTVDILKYNLKREQECPEVIIKHKYEENAQYVRFVRNMSLFVILQTKLHFYRINIVC